MVQPQEARRTSGTVIRGSFWRHENGQTYATPTYSYSEQTSSQVAKIMEINDSHDPKTPDTLGIKALVYEVTVHRGTNWASAAHQASISRRDKARPDQPSYTSVGGVEVSDDLLQTIEKNLAQSLVSGKPRGSKSLSRKKRFRSSGVRTLEPQETAFAAFEQMKPRASKSMHTLGGSVPSRKDVLHLFRSMLLGIR
jgi:hypothetical protein